MSVSIAAQLDKSLRVSRAGLPGEHPASGRRYGRGTAATRSPGQRDPEVLAALTRRTMKAKHDALLEALDGMFDDHHGEIAALLLDQIVALDAKIAQLSARAMTMPRSELCRRQAVDQV